MKTKLFFVAVVLMCSSARAQSVDGPESLDDLIIRACSARIEAIDLFMSVQALQARSEFLMSEWYAGGDETQQALAAAVYVLLRECRAAHEPPLLNHVRVLNEEFRALPTSGNKTLTANLVIANSALVKTKSAAWNEALVRIMLNADGLGNNPPMP